MKKSKLESLLLITALGFSSSVTAEGGLFERDTMLPDLGRGGMADKGYALELSYVGDYVTNSSGGIKQDSVYLDNTSLALSIDLEKMAGLPGSTFALSFLGNGGGDPSGELVGDAQGVDNIESPNTQKLYEIWYEGVFGSMGIKMGLIDLNSEFDVTETAGLFINSSHGIGVDYSQSGPSIFPILAAGLRLSYQVNENIYVQVAGFDGVPGDPEDEDDINGPHVKFDEGDGYMVAFEGGLQQGDDKTPYRKLAVGAWYFTEADEVSGENNNGFYMIADGNVLPESGDSNQGLSVFLRYGMANDKVNAVGSYLGAGAVYTGLVPGRDADQLGVSIARATLTTDMKSFMEAADMEVGSEMTIELTYRAQIFPWLAIQPDMQIVQNPSFDSAADSVQVINVRTEIVF